MTAKRLLLAAALVPAFGPLSGQAVDVPNPSFERGADAPAGWRLCEGAGEWRQGDAASGERSVAATGAGEDFSYWRSDPIALEPGAVYRLRYRVRRVSGSAGGAPIAGPILCNSTLHGLTGEWQQRQSVFVAQKEVKPDEAWLRFGQWHVNGTVAFDDIELVGAIPVHFRRGEFVLGEGETIRGADYVFQAPFHTESRSCSRPLAWNQCYFNTNRWVFGRDSEVVYRHRIGERRQLSATLNVSVRHYVSGALLVEAGLDGKTWQPLGAMDGKGAKDFPIPADMLPAAEVWVRLSTTAKDLVSQKAGAGSLQVGAYEYRATVDGAPAELDGWTRFVSVTRRDQRIEAAIDALGDGLPGADNVVVARITNRTGEVIAAKPAVTLRHADGGAPLVSAVEAALAPGETLVRIPYAVRECGTYEVAVTLGAGIDYRAEAQFHVAELFRASYGELLPGSSAAVGLWWTHSGWKISRTRPAPEIQGDALVIRAAKNETDAAQIVVRPATPLRGFTAAGGALTGPGGAEIPAANIEVLRVRYVNVTIPSDSSSVVGPWPDPLPPFSGPIDLEADRNQPLWVRVTVPRSASAGLYRGVLRLTAQGWGVDVPVAVTVYDFTLPDRMSCTTAFGFSPHNVWRYQKIRDPAQRRAVLDKYWRNLSAHHISPYDPAPLDPWRVEWPGGVAWRGGVRDGEVRHSGAYSLRLADESAKSTPTARHNKLAPIGEGGVRVRFWYKTDRADAEFTLSINHHDAAGKWLRGKNSDSLVRGNGEWQQFERVFDRFPEGAASLRVMFCATRYTPDGRHTGTVWFDDVSVQDAATGAGLLEDSDFEPPAPEKLAPKFDWTAWDEAMTRATDVYHFNSLRLRLQGLGGGTFHARHEPSLLGFGADTPQYKAAFGAYCRAIETHLRDKGWLDEAFVYWFDEPDQKDYEFVLNGFRRLREAAPGLTGMLTEQIEPGLIGGPEIWCPLTPKYDHEQAEERRKLGERFWWYVCCSPKAPYVTMFTDHPGVEMRVWLWQSWKYKVEGVLVWHVNYWTSPCAYPDPERPQNMYEDPMAWVSGYDTPAGVKKPWWNGAGHFIYPPEAAAEARQAETVLDGPVDSIRWEMLRDGIEDYEYLALLKRLCQQHAGRLSDDERGRCEALLVVPDDIAVDMTAFTRDPAPIEARRHEIARAIEMLANR